MPWEFLFAIRKPFWQCRRGKKLKWRGESPLEANTHFRKVDVRSKSRSDFAPESPGSIRGYCEIDGDIRSRLDGLRADKMRFEVPLPNGFLSGIGKNWRSAKHVQVFN